MRFSISDGINSWGVWLYGETDLAQWKTYFYGGGGKFEGLEKFLDLTTSGVQNALFYSS